MSMTIEEYAEQLMQMVNSMPQSIIRKKKIKPKKTLIRKQFTKTKR